MLFDILLIYIQNLKQNKNKNKNRLLIKTKKTELKQIVSKFVVDLNRTNSKKKFAKFYNFATKSFSNSKLSTKLLDKNIISFYFDFVCVSLVYIFLKK